MRGDRLLKLMLLLQGRGRQTGARLAAALEVSPRTLYRDLRALEAAGVPLTTESGPGGGVALMDDWTTDLTGLTAREAEALFATGVPRQLAALGLAAPLAAALAKLAAGSPKRLRGREELTRRRLLLDSAAPDAAVGAANGAAGAANGAAGATAPSVDAAAPLARFRLASLEGRRLRLAERLQGGPLGGVNYTRLFDTYGLVWSADRWYAVGAADGRIRAVRVAAVLAAEATDEGPDGGRYDIPDDFDLEEFWRSEQARVAAAARAYPVDLELEAAAAPWLGEPYAGRAAAALATAAAAARPPAPVDWPPPGLPLDSPRPRYRLRLEFGSAEEAAAHLAAVGAAARIIDPPELRLALAALGRALAAAHGAGPAAAQAGPRSPDASGPLPPDAPPG